MICPKCGSITPDAPFCTNCGAKIEGMAQEPVHQPEPQSQPVYDPIYNGAYQPSMNEPVRRVTFAEAIRNFFKKYAVFSGRATRSEYWYAALFVVLVDVALTGLGSVFYDSFLGLVFSGLSWVFALAVFLPQLGLAWRRLHDIGKSGAWYFIAFVPLVGFIIALVFYCTDSKEDNQYGPRRTESNRLLDP